MMQGKATVLEDSEAENADSDLAKARIQMGIKYNGGHGQPAQDNPPPNTATARGRNGRWIAFQSATQVSWDNYKLAALN
jgi:hypothetical protein